MTFSTFQIQNSKKRREIIAFSAVWNQNNELCFPNRSFIDNAFIVPLTARTLGSGIFRNFSWLFLAYFSPVILLFLPGPHIYPTYVGQEDTSAIVHLFFTCIPDLGKERKVLASKYGLARGHK